VAKSDSPAIKKKTKELREELRDADMSEFDRMMKHLIQVPKEESEKALKRQR